LWRFRCRRDHPPIAILARFLTGVHLRESPIRLSPARRYGCSLPDDDVATSHVVEVFLLLFVVETVKREVLCAAQERKASGSQSEASCPTRLGSLSVTQITKASVWRHEAGSSTIERGVKAAHRDARIVRTNGRSRVMQAIGRIQP
jgi:hypothetical protein